VAVKARDDVYDWQGGVWRTSTERTTKSQTYPKSVRGRLLWFGRSPAIPATDRRCWGGTVPACNRLSESILLLFVVYNLAECVVVYTIVGDLADVIQLCNCMNFQRYSLL